MNSDLEALLKAYDAWRESINGDDASRRESIYFSMLEDFIEKTPGTNMQSLHSAIRTRYPVWLRAQKKNSSPPPTA